MKIDWICSNCGAKYGNHAGQLSTWHSGDYCDVCWRYLPVTQGGDFGVYSLSNEEVTAEREATQKANLEGNKKEGVVGIFKIHPPAGLPRDNRES